MRTRLHPGYAGLQTSVQDYPGRIGLWHVGVPPSGPMDALSHRLANALVGNTEDAAALEFSLTGERPAANAREHGPPTPMQGSGWRDGAACAPRAHVG